MKHFICPLGRRGSSRPALGMSPGDQLLWPTWPWSSAMFTLTTAYQPCVGAPPLYPGGGSAMGRPNHCPVRVAQPWTPDIAVGAVQLPVVGVDLRYEVRAHRLRDLRPDIYCVPRWRRWPEPSAALAAACSHGDGQWPWTAGFACHGGHALRGGIKERSMVSSGDQGRPDPFATTRWPLGRGARRPNAL